MSDELANQQDIRQRWVVLVIVALSLAAGLYRLLAAHRLQTTSATLLGIPALLAVLVALTPRAKTVAGGIMKTIALMLLIVSPLLGEGWFCILLVSPLFFLVGGIVGFFADRARRQREARVLCLALVLLPMSLEGVVPALTVNREQSVEVTRTVRASSAEVEAALRGQPHLERGLPWLLRIGFPRPLAAGGDGLQPGAQRTIRFSGVEGAPAGDLVTRIVARRPGYVRSEAVDDSSKLAHWMHWESSEVWWQPVDAAHTRVIWRIHYRRGLDPAWYFAPWERAAVRAAATYMIEAQATPEATR